MSCLSTRFTFGAVCVRSREKSRIEVCVDGETGMLVRVASDKLEITFSVTIPLSRFMQPYMWLEAVTR